MAAYLLGIFIEELQDEVGYIVCTGTIDGFDEFAADGRQVEVEEIRVGTLQIIHKGGNGKVTFIAAVRVLFFADKVGYGEECGAIYALRFADVLHALVSES